MRYNKRVNLIKVEHLSKKFRTYQKTPGFLGSLKSFVVRKYFDVNAVSDISFAIDEGELIGFIGPNGAGKTTTLKCLSGLIHPSEGKVSVLGHEPFKRNPAFLRQISLVMGQKNQLWWDLPPMETFLLNKEIYQIPEMEFKDRIEELSELLDVKDVLNTQTRKLSLGQRMKCELMAAIIHTPKILFLDEPTIGLDVVVQEKLRNFIREYNIKHKATILLTSHYMQDVKELCKRVIIIDHGKIMYDGMLDSVVKKFSGKKVITVTFERPVDRSRLVQLGTIESYENRKVRLIVPLQKANHATAKLLDEYEIEDLNIEEPDIEEVIRSVFSRKKV